MRVCIPERPKEVNYHRLKSVAFHRTVDMLHSKTRTIRIWTNKPVYWDSRVGNLGKTRFGEVLRCPLQHGFNSDSQRGFSVAVHNHTTLLTLVQSVVSSMVSFIHCTAMRTPLRSVVSVNKLKRDTELFTIRSKKLSKASVRDFVDFPVSLFVEPVFSASKTQFFNSNRGIVRLGEIHDFLGNLTASGLDKISLFMSKFVKIFLSFSRAFISVASKFFSPFKIFSLFLCYVSSKVKLPLHFRSLRVEDCYGGERGRPYIYTNNKSSVILWLRKLFFKNNHNSTTTQKRDVTKTPSLIKEGVEPFKLIVKFNGNRKGLVRRIGNLKTWVSSFRSNQFEPSFVKSNGTSLKFIFNRSSLSPNVFSSLLNDVGGQKGGFTYV